MSGTGPLTSLVIGWLFLVGFLVNVVCWYLLLLSLLISFVFMSTCIAFFDYKLQKILCKKYMRQRVEGEGEFTEKMVRQKGELGRKDSLGRGGPLL